MNSTNAVHVQWNRLDCTYADYHQNFHSLSKSTGIKHNMHEDRKNYNLTSYRSSTFLSTKVCTYNRVTRQYLIDRRHFKHFFCSYTKEVCPSNYALPCFQATIFNVTFYSSNNRFTPGKV